MNQALWKPLLGIIVASAIPVVMFALWAEYFCEDWRKSRESGERMETDSSIFRLRLAGFLSISLQLVIFLATSPVRNEDPSAGVWGLWVTLAALVFQRIHQASVERMLLEADSGEEAGRELRVAPSILGTSLLWAFAGVVLYLGILGGTLFATAVSIAILKLSGPAAVGAVVIGTLAGYTAALASNFILSPWILGKMLSSSSFQEGAVRTRIESWFKAAGIPLPELRVLSPGAPLLGSNAWVSGVNGFSRLGLKPTLWLTQNLLQTLSEGELEAVIKHEIAHLKLNHLTHRFLLAWSMSILVLLTVAGAMLLSAWLPGTQTGPILPAFSLFLAVAMVWGSIRALAEQSRNHELEADRFCVTGLGARASSLVSALKKVEATQPTSTATGAGTHPVLELRVLALEPLLELERRHDRSVLNETKRAA